MASTWALDLGTTNSGIATWDAAARRPRFLELHAVCRKPGDGTTDVGAEDHLEAPRLVPSAVHVVEATGFWGKLATWGPFKTRLWGQHAVIGRPALELNRGSPRPEFVSSFKAALMRSPLKTLARRGNDVITAREAGRLFLRELMREAKLQTGERIEDLVVTTPVDAYETFRAEIVAIAKDLGIDRLRFIDEPVAAALGYGVGIGAKKTVLVVDIGGGTAHAAVIELSHQGVQQGQSRVLAKTGRQLGGNLVDRWLAEEACDRLGFPLRDRERSEESRFWWLMLLEEARRVKESVFFNEKDAFYLTPPEDMRAFEARVRGDATLVELTREDVRDLLVRRNWYRDVDQMIDEVVAGAANAGSTVIDEVLMVGGSTLLPDVYGRMERRFGRDRVRAWQPFEAIAYGAAAFAAGALTQSDLIVHDYAFVTHDAKTNEPRHTLIVPRGTRAPTATDLWKRQLVPTCALGEPERLFKLVIAEIGQAEPDERRFAWDEGGALRKVGGQGGASETEVVVPLNADNPTLGELDPPHEPGDKRPRLEIAFGVNADRWLIATVRDLKTGKQLMNEKPVVRLL
ncbi:MAG: Hsp70 family protein [Deltaproteobacteria bacterium]|jgi:molecular chaperone DnaK (HSP70)|nr:Hsp70 family protein [Deltaproteobacteria bacterium]